MCRARLSSLSSIAAAVRVVKIHPRGGMLRSELRSHCARDGSGLAPQQVMRLLIEMPAVAACEAIECAYNVGRSCHARAITIGDGDHPACDTRFISTTHCLDTSHRAGVGACKVSSCKHNRDYECDAEGVQIGHHGGHADCKTFSPR